MYFCARKGRGVEIADELFGPLTAHERAELYRVGAAEIWDGDTPLAILRLTAWPKPPVVRPMEKRGALGKVALNVPRLVQDFGKKLVERYKRDRHQHAPLLEGAPAEKAAEAVIDRIAQQDPTANKEYTAWLTGSYARGGIRRFEDIASRALPALKRFHALKVTKRLPLGERDINRLKSLEELEDLNARHEDADTTSKRQQRSDMEKWLIDSGEASVLLNDAKYKVVIPKTEGAAKYFGINTRWCTAANQNNMFDEYNRQGPLYIILVKAENRRYQFHMQSAQFMSENDSPIDPATFFDEYPEMAVLFEPLAEDAEARCDSCGGSGEQMCTYCEGNGNVRCGVCNGDGWGDEKCDECDGRGQVTDADGDAEECPNCKGGGGEPCAFCDTDGYEECERCGGDGSLNCEECDGSGQSDELINFRDEALGPSSSRRRRGPRARRRRATPRRRTSGGARSSSTRPARPRRRPRRASCGRPTSSRRRRSARSPWGSSGTR